MNVVFEEEKVKIRHKMRYLTHVKSKILSDQTSVFSGDPNNTRFVYGELFFYFIFIFVLILLFAYLVEVKCLKGAIVNSNMILHMRGQQVGIFLNF